MRGDNYLYRPRCLTRICYRRCLTDLLPAFVIAHTGQSQSTAQNQIPCGDLTRAAYAALKGPQHLVAEVSVHFVVDGCLNPHRLG